METGFLQLQAGQIFWRKWGRGKHMLICFHGFADTGNRFEALAEALPDDIVLIAPDLPWHGASQWNIDELKPFHIKEMVEGFLEEHEPESCFILVHSWGGRLVIGAMPLLESGLNTAWVVSPGGFVNGFYWGLENLPNFLRMRLIKFAETKMSIFSTRMEFLGKMGLLNPTALRYLLISLEKMDHRRQLFPVWKNLVNFKLNHKPLRNLKTPVIFLVGENDALLSISKVRNFSGKIPSSSFFLLQNTGHWPDWALLAKKIVEGIR